MERQIREIVAEDNRKSALTSETEKQRQYRREYYKKNKDKMRENAHKYSKTIVNRVMDIKAKTPCKDCGRIFPAECMDFARSEKRSGLYVSELARYGDWEAVQQAIEDCDLLCACCHRIRLTKERTKVLVQKSVKSINTEL